MRLRKKFAMFLLAVTAACFMAASAVFAFAAGSGVKVEDFFTADGLTLTENVAGTSLKDGGGTVLFPDEDKTGIQVGGEGGTLTVNKSLFGAFEMDFRVWAETTMTSGEWGNFADTAAYNTREVAITLDDGNNKFTIHVRGGDAGRAIAPSAYVSYGDGTDLYAMKYSDTTGAFENYRLNGYGTWLTGTSFVNRARGFGTFLNPEQTVSNVVGFDPETMEVYAYANTANNASVQKYVIWKLDEKAASFAGVDDSATAVANQPTIASFASTYTATISVTAQSGKNAQMVIYSINGAELVTENGEFAAASPQILSVPSVEEGQTAGSRLVLPAPQLYDLFNGTYAFEGTVSAMRNGEPAQIEGLSDGSFAEGCYLVLESGDYTLTYTPVKNGLTGESTQISFTVTSDADYSDKTFGDILAPEDVVLSERSVSGTELKDGGGTALFPSEEKGGVQLTSATGGTVRFTNRLTGAFEMDFRVWAETTMMSGEWGNFADTNAYNTREVAITLDDGNNKFTIHIRAGDEWKAIIPTAYVSYGDGTDLYAMKYSDTTGAFENYRLNGYGTWLTGTSFVNRARGYGTWLNPEQSVSNVVGFDPETLEVYAYANTADNSSVQKYVIWKLDEKATSFSGYPGDQEEAIANQPTISSFGSNYTVTVSLTAQSGKNAQMVIYSVNGQSLETNYAGQIYNTAGPVAESIVMADTVPVGGFAALPACTFTDILDGTVAGYTVAIQTEDGTDVALEKGGADGSYQDGCGFTPSAAGTYTVTYRAVDAQGRAGTCTFKVVAGEPVPEFVSFPDYENEITEGDLFILPVPTLKDTLNGEYAFTGTVTATLNGDAVHIDGLSGGAFAEGCYIIAREGTYVFTYTPERGGYTGEEQEITVTAAGNPDISEKKYGDLFAAEDVQLSARSVYGSQLKDGSGTALFSSEDKGGVQLTSATGGEVAFINNLAGTFEIDFRVWADTTMMSGEWGNFADTNAYNTREVAITLDDGNNKFTIHVRGGDAGRAIAPSAYVSYGDGTDLYAMKYSDTTGAFENYRLNGYGTWLTGTSFVNRARGFGTFLNPEQTVSNVIGFDPETLEVYAYANTADNSSVQKYVIWKLDEKATSFSGYPGDQEEAIANQPTISSFGSNYTVTVSLTAQSGKNAQMVIYSVNGQSLRTDADGNIVNTAGPVRAKSVLILPGEVGKFYTLPEAVYADVLDGAVAAEIVSVTGPDGEAVELGQDAGGFTPAAAGEYKITYAAKDAQGMKAGQLELVITVNDASSYPSPGEGEIPEGTEPPEDPSGEIEEQPSKLPDDGQPDPEEGGGCSGSAAGAGAMAAAAVLGAAAAVLIRKKHKNI